MLFMYGKDLADCPLETFFFQVYYVITFTCHNIVRSIILYKVSRFQNCLRLYSRLLGKLHLRHFKLLLHTIIPRKGVH